MNKFLSFLTSVLLIGLCLMSCSKETDDFNAYADWQVRNEAWFQTIADSARTAIQTAQRAYGDQWEEHCDWRMMKSLLKSQTAVSGKLSDSICVRILSRGDGLVSPCFTDTVRINFRGWLMPTKTADGAMEERVFTQTYYGDFNTETAAPQVGCVSSFKDGFATALQYMVEGDDWMVYIPADLFYGETNSSTIPAYSVARFRINLIAIYPAGTKVPAWK